MRRSKRRGKTVYVDNESSWWKEDLGRIGIKVGGKHGFISSVSPDPESERGNAHLFYKLARCLRAAGAPHPPIPDDG